MSIPFSGTFKRSLGVVEAINKNVKKLNLKGVQRITVKFDPFHDQAKHTRDFLYYISAPKLANAAPNYVIKTEILCNREEPSVTVKLQPEISAQAGTKVVTFKSKNITCLEIFELFNKHITPLAPPEEEIQVKETKSSKKTKSR